MISSSQCAERSGFLFKHNCDRMAEHECQQCGKKICQRHTVSTTSGEEVVGASSALSLACTTCAKQRGRIQGEGYESSYYYGHTYYNGWGRHHYSHSSSPTEVPTDPSTPPAVPVMASAETPDYDPNDLTEADGEATEVPGDEGFETDMEGS